jgi:hypothetical protein
MRAAILAALVLSGPALAQDLNAIRYHEEEPADLRVLWCGTAPETYPMSMLVPDSLTVTAAQLLQSLHVQLDRTHYCVATALAHGRFSPPSNEIRFFCARVGSGPAHQRRVQCFQGDRVPPGQIGR